MLYYLALQMSGATVMVLVSSQATDGDLTNVCLLLLRRKQVCWASSVLPKLSSANPAGLQLQAANAGLPTLLTSAMSFTQDIADVIL